jgi:hypothetical protein
MNPVINADLQDPPYRAMSHRSASADNDLLSLLIDGK